MGDSEKGYTDALALLNRRMEPKEPISTVETKRHLRYLRELEEMNTDRPTCAQKSVSGKRSEVQDREGDLRCHWCPAACPSHSALKRHLRVNHYVPKDRTTLEIVQRGLLFQQQKVQGSMYRNLCQGCDRIFDQCQNHPMPTHRSFCVTAADVTIGEAADTVIPAAPQRPARISPKKAHQAAIVAAKPAPTKITAEEIDCPIVKWPAALLMQNVESFLVNTAH